MKHGTARKASEHDNTSTAPELDTTRDAPQVVYENGPELVFDKSPPEAVENTPAEPPATDTTSKELPTSGIFKRAIWIPLVFLFLLASAIGLGVGIGVIEKKTQLSRHKPPSTSSGSGPIPISTTVSSSSTSSVQPSSPSAISSGISSAILNDTSITATCPNGDRWVFFQDAIGNIRIAKYSFAASAWSVPSSSTISSLAKIKSPLDASCINLPDNMTQPVWSGLSYLPGPGIWIQIIYLDHFDGLRITTFNDGSWQDYAMWPTLLPPSNITKLSISTVLSPSLINGTAAESDLFTSTAVFQSTDMSIVMVNSDPIIPANTSYNSEDPPINPNIFSSLLNSTSIETPNLGTSLSCIDNSQTPSFIPSHFFTACCIGKSIEVWEYNQSSPNQNTSMTRFTLSTAANNNDPDPADVSLVVFGGQIAVVSLLPNHTIMSFGISLLAPIPHNPPFLASASTTWSTTIPFTHMSATSLPNNSTKLYVYYQVNDSAIAEIYYDSGSGFWPAEPEYIFIP